MTTDRIRQDISLAITGYRTQLVELERIVDADGYQPTLNGLNDASQGYELSGFWADLESGSRDGQGSHQVFASSLSIKSKGLLLTSSLMTGNESLYRSMCTSVQQDVKGLYSQDLYSLLGDEFAPMVLSEMTTRASRDVNELGIYNTSLQTLDGSILPTNPRPLAGRIGLDPLQGRPGIRVHRKDVRRGSKDLLRSLGQVPWCGASRSHSEREGRIRQHGREVQA